MRRRAPIAHSVGGAGGGADTELGAGINVTPLIDVVMVLIVFFLIVGKLASERSAAVRLPESAVGRSDEARPIVLAVVRGPGAGPATLLIDDRPVEPADMPRALSARAAELARDLSARSGTPVLATDVPVEVRADRDADFADVAPVLRAARLAKLTSIRLVTSRAGEREVRP